MESSRPRRFSFLLAGGSPGVVVCALVLVSSSCGCSRAVLTRVCSMKHASSAPLSFFDGDAAM